MKKNKNALRILEIAGVKQSRSIVEGSHDSRVEDVLGAITHAQDKCEDVELAIGFIEEALYELNMDMNANDKRILKEMDHYITSISKLLTTLERSAPKRLAK